MPRQSRNNQIHVDTIEPCDIYVTINNKYSHEHKETTQSITDNQTNWFTREALGINRFTIGTVSERYSIGQHNGFEIPPPYSEVAYNRPETSERDQWQTSVIATEVFHQSRIISVKPTSPSQYSKYCCDYCGQKHCIICTISTVVVAIIVVVTIVLTGTLSQIGSNRNTLSPTVAIGPTFPTTYLCSSSSPCGCSIVSATLTKIVGGEAASSQTWGWAVSLNIGSSSCGGSIISASWILTAAHCVSRASPGHITVFAGSNAKLTSSQTRLVSTVTIHPKYSSSTFVNDIALLRLSTPLNMADPSVNVICLPSMSQMTLLAGEWPPAGTTVTAVGWGRLNENGLAASTLQQVTMETIDHKSSTCSPVIKDWSVQFCASAPSKDTCQGDSGGPLMAFTSSNQWVLTGVTSSGIGCARPNYAGSYTRIVAYQTWINASTNGQFINPSSSMLN